uniref:Uncharacterized protein n=1 Tax=Palpitomonas bilix TaxID=652834 RepID=A0A7S3LVX1_9EUKA
MDNERVPDSEESYIVQFSEFAPNPTKSDDAQEESSSNTVNKNEASRNSALIFAGAQEESGSNEVTGCRFGEAGQEEKQGNKQLITLDKLLSDPLFLAPSLEASSSNSNKSPKQNAHKVKKPKKVKKAKRVKKAKNYRVAANFHDALAHTRESRKGSL